MTPLTPDERDKLIELIPLLFVLWIGYMIYANHGKPSSVPVDHYYSDSDRRSDKWEARARP